MAVSLYFGLPGCGKTTMLVKLAADAIRHGRYRNVYTNVNLRIPGVTVIDNDCIGKYELADCLLLIDEATLFADSRSYKTFDRGKLEYFLEHRHRNADIVLFTQQWDGVDRKIRVITDRVYYVYKGVLTGRWLSKCYRIPYGIIIPDPRRGGEKLGEIVQGYARPPIWVRMFAQVIYRPRYYPYFDSWELEPLPDLPLRYQPFDGDIDNAAPAVRYWRDVGGMLRLLRGHLRIGHRQQRKADRDARRVAEMAALDRLSAAPGVYDVPQTKKG